MGVDENKLRISYVTAVALNQAHMVLTYYATTDQTPLILDNLMPTILPATQRTDLVPVYSFNGSSLWLARSQASGTPDSNADRLSIWLDLKKRLTEIP
jgi:predicted transglutaminase-like cysteine proteinase